MNEYMAAQMDIQIEGSLCENERLRTENEMLRSVLEHIKQETKYYNQGTYEQNSIWQIANSALNAK